MLLGHDPECAVAIVFSFLLRLPLPSSKLLLLNPYLNPRPRSPPIRQRSPSNDDDSPRPDRAPAAASKTEPAGHGGALPPPADPPSPPRRRHLPRGGRGLEQRPLPPQPRPRPRPQPRPRRELRQGGGRHPRAAPVRAAAARGGGGVGQDLRRQPGGAARAGRDAHGGLHHGAQPDHPGPGRLLRRRRPLGRRQPAPLPPRNSGQVPARRQRGPLRRLHRRLHLAAHRAGHGEPPPQPPQAPRQPRQARHHARHGRARHRRLPSPALRRRVPARHRRECPPPAAPLPRGHQLLLLRRRLPLLRLGRQQRHRAARLRAPPAILRRPLRRPRHGAHLHQPARRNARRRRRRYVQARPRGSPSRHRRDRVAQRRRLRPDRRQRAQRRRLQQEPRGADGQERRHAGAAWRQDAGVRLLALQREPQARPGHRAPLGPLLPQRHGRVPGRPHRAAAAVGVPASASAGEQHAVQGPDMVRAGRPRRQEAERDGDRGRADVRVRPGERDVRRHPARRRLLPAQHRRGARQLRLQLLLAAAQEDRSYVLLQQPRRADHQGPKLWIMQVPEFIGVTGCTKDDDREGGGGYDPDHFLTFQTY